MQKLEERLLKIGKNSNYLKENRYFKANGEIKLHNDLHSIEVTRPKDLATEIWGPNNAYQTVDNNAIVCDRLNSQKRKYYTLNIIIGKLYLNQYHAFEEEEREMMELK